MANRNFNRNVQTPAVEEIIFAGQLVVTGSSIAQGLMLSGSAINGIKGVDGARMETANKLSLYFHDTFPTLDFFRAELIQSSAPAQLAIVNLGMGTCTGSVFQKGTVPCVTASVQFTTTSTGLAVAPTQGTTLLIFAALGNSSAF